MESDKSAKPTPARVGVRIVKAQDPSEVPTVFTAQKKIEKSD